MTKKRIAVLIDWYLPGAKAGGPVRSVYSLMNLLRSDYEFFIITTNHDLGSATPYERITPDTWTSYNDVPVYYFSDEQLNASSLIKLIDALNADIIYLNSFWSYYFSILPLRLKKQGRLKQKIILAPRGMLSKGALSLKAFKKRLFIFLSKLRGLHRDILFHATTAGEQEEIRRFFPGAQVKIASNVNAAQPLENKQLQKHPGELKLFYLSRVARVKNLHFALDVLQQILPPAKIEYDIYGAIEDKAYKAQCDAIIEKLPRGITVRFKGELEFDAVQDTIRNYHFLLLPTLNENFGHSIVESLLSACPVIISDRTPWNGVNAANCGYAISLNHKEGFINAVNRAVQMDDIGYRKTCLNCITFIKEKISIAEDIKAYKNLFS